MGGVSKRSGDQLQSGVQGALLDLRTLAEPGRVHAVLVTASTAFVVDVLGHSVEQAPGRAACRVQLAASATDLVQLLDLPQGALVGQHLRQRAGRIGFAEHIHEEAQRLMPLHFAFG